MTLLKKYHKIPTMKEEKIPEKINNFYVKNTHVQQRSVRYVSEDEKHSFSASSLHPFCHRRGCKAGKNKFPFFNYYLCS